MSKPCLHCIRVMKAIGVRKVFYTTGNFQEGEWVSEKISEIETTHSSYANSINK